MRNTAESLRYVIYLFVTDLKEPWKVIAEPAGFLIAPRGWERVSDVSNVVFTNGCNGNLKAIGKLVNGMTVEQIEGYLLGNQCGMKGTSCADQLAQAVRKCYDESRK